MLSTGAFFCALGRFCAPEHFLRPGALGRPGAFGRGDEILRPSWGVGVGRLCILSPLVRPTPAPGRLSNNINMKFENIFY